MGKSRKNGQSYTNSSNRTQIIEDPQQDNAGVNNPNVPGVGDDAGTKMLAYHKGKLISGQNIIWTRSG